MKKLLIFGTFEHKSHISGKKTVFYFIVMGKKHIFGTFEKKSQISVKKLFFFRCSDFRKKKWFFFVVMGKNRSRR